MYNFIKDKEFLGNLRATCSDIINQLVQYINNDRKLEVAASLVGSGAKHLETQNENEPVDLDYNLVILKTNTISINDCKSIKEYIRKSFNKILRKNDLEDCQDSTSVLSTNKIHFLTVNQTLFSIDLAIVFEYEKAWFRLIHEKTGNTHTDRYYWNEGPNSKGLSLRVEWIKENGLWEEVRHIYLDKKNMYLRRGDNNHPSFICYIETVNEVYQIYHKR